MKLASFFAAVAVCAATSSAGAATLTFTADEYDGDGSIGEALIQSWNVVLGAGESIVSALFESSFGNSQVDSTAEGFLTVGGVTVATCDGPGNICWDGPGETISYNFSAGEFASLLGPIDLFYTQTDCCVIRLGASRLTIETAVAAVPLPATAALLVPAIGLLAAGARRRRRQA